MVGLKEGSTLKRGKYKIIRILGQGSFGITYLAATRVSLDGQLGKMDVNVNVTIKEFFMSDLNNRAADGTSVERTSSTLVKNYLNKFRREAENLSKLHHSNIVKVLEVFDENNTSYYVMEFIDGETLDEYIKSKGHLSESESLRITQDLCPALSYMHEHKMLHLDLKPKNIMRDSEGHIYLIDFGLAKQYNDNGEPESSTNLGLGTPGYAPIEQAHYKQDGTFPVTLDVYAVGASLYKMLTGKTPPESSAILNEGFPMSSLQKAGISANTISIVEKAMAPIKKDRYQTIAALLVDVSTLSSFVNERTEEGTIIDQEVDNKTKVTIYPDTDKIYFRFTGSSYPGSISYETNITEDTIALKIYSYSGLLYEGEFPFNNSRLSELINVILSLGIQQKDIMDDAEGGERLTLKLYKDGNEYYSGYIYGNEYQQFEGTTDANFYILKREIEKCFPDIQSLLSKERTEKSEDGEDKKSVLKKYRWLLYIIILLVVLIQVSRILIGNGSSKARAVKELTGDFSSKIETVNSKEIDLGLPSGTIWAGWNVGANAADDYGALYTWGALSPHNKESSNDYYNSLSTLYVDSVCYSRNGMISGSEYDVAHKIWGNNWCIPTKEQVDELVNQCEWKWGSYKGCNGMIGKGPNGNLIFFPATGYRNENGTWSKNEDGDYWCGDLCDPSKHDHSNYDPSVVEDARNHRRANCYGFSESREIYSGCTYRYYGYAVRPVKK